MSDTPDPVTAYLSEVEARARNARDAERLNMDVTLSLARNRSARDVPRLLKAVDAVLAEHDDLAVYCGADECDHVQPSEDAPAWREWDASHPLGEGDVGRICLLTEVGRYCPACTTMVYEDDPVGENYVAAGNCIVRPAITTALLGEDGT